MTRNHLYTAEIFFVRALLPYASGIAFSWYFANDTWLNVLILLTSILFSMMLFMQAFYNLFELYNNKGLTGLSVSLFLFACGGLNCILQQHHYRSDHFEHSRFDFLKVRIIDDPQTKNSTVRCKVTVLKGYKKNVGIKPASGNLMLYLTQHNDRTAARYSYGTEMIIPSKYLAVPAPENPGEFDYQFWLATQNIRHQCFLRMKQVEILPVNNGNKLIKFAFGLRAQQIKYFQKILYNKEAFALASTLILGSRTDLSTEILDMYSRTGTIHALSVSGMHVGLIYLVVSWILQFLNKKRSLYILQMLLIIVLVWLYTLVTGFSPSVLRSAIMLSIFLIAKTFNKQINSYNILAFTAFCMLVYNPLYLWDVGFQLSFLAVLGLIGLQPKLQYSLDIKSVWLQKLWNMAAISLAAQITTFPLGIYYFHQFPIYFIISNFFIIAPIALLMYLGLAVLIFRLDKLAPLFEWLIDFTNMGLDFIAELPFSSISGIWISKTALTFLSLTVILFCLAFTSRSKKKFMSGMFCLLAYIGTTRWVELAASWQEKKITFKLRGHYAEAHLKGYAALIITDLKPGDKLYKYSIQPALDLYYIRKLKILSPDTLTNKK